MSRTSMITFAVAGLFALTSVGLGASTAEARQSAHAQQIKAQKLKAAELRQQQALAGKSAMPRQSGMKIPGTSIEMPDIGGCKLNMKSWQSSINKLLKEEC